MVTHYTQDDDIDAEMLAGIRAHYDGLFQWGIDVAVVNVTKEAIWYRKAVLPDFSGSVPPFRELAAAEAAGRIQLPDEVVFPEPRSSREKEQDQKYRDMEIDPKEYYPADVYREPGTKWPKGFKIKTDDVIKNRKK
jgi:hypothetical protein